MSSDREGFLKLSDNGNRRDSKFNHQSSVEGSQSQHYHEEVKLGMGQWLKMKLRIEREDGSLLICGTSLANNCQAILVIFGFFFIFAGVVLTIISYKTPINAKLQDSSSTREQGKIAGPVFIVVGSILFVIGLLLSLISWKLHQEAKIQRNRFSLEGLPHAIGPEDAQTEFIFSKATTPVISWSFPASRRESIFSSNYYTGRRKTLPTISQAVPVGFVIDGVISGIGKSSPLVELTGDSQRDDEMPELSQRESSASSRRKASLTLRASLPIPLLGSPNFMRVRSVTPVEPSCVVTTRSDEPYGSIVSLSGTGDIACFPAHSPRFPLCKRENLNSAFTFFERNDIDLKINNNRELPIITINECVNPLGKTNEDCV